MENINWKAPYKILGFWVIVMWGIYFINLILGNYLNSFGIQPRSFSGLFGIFISPFLHGSLFHLIGNTIPFLILGGIIATFYKDHFISILLSIAFIGGLCTWLLGESNSNHIGASGVVFGLAGFSIGAGFFTKKFIPIIISIVVISYSGLSLIIGLLPLMPGVSYLGHWMGLFAGLGISYLYKYKTKESI